MKPSQTLVWRYLAMHRKVTGDSLSYLTLLQDAHYRQEAHAKAMRSGDAALIALSEQAQAWMQVRASRQPGAGNVSVSSEPYRTEQLDEVGKAGAPATPSSVPRIPDERTPRRVMGTTTLLGVGLAAIAAVAFVGGALVGQDGPQPVLSHPKAESSTAAVREKRITVSAPITQSQTWRADNTYVLTAPIFVEAGVALTIEAGTRIEGMPGSTLIVTRDATLYARGKRSAPIVFTSAKDPGERARGDWGGLVLLGNAPINQGTARIEGVDDKDPRGLFGGDEVGDNCGLLEYVRVEFAGYEVFTDNELNGLTLGGCGHKTIVRNVQVHRSLDDGIEVFGGDVDLKNVVVTGARDDGFDWDMGWHGRVQFLVVQQHPDEGDNGFEADNWKADHDAQPRSAPTFYNVTLVGGLNAKKAQRAMTLRRGTAGGFHNFIVTGFNKEAIDVRDARTAALATTGELTLDHSLFFEIGPDGRSYFASEDGEGDDDKGFDEARFFQRIAAANRFNEPPLLSEAAFHVAKPDFTPLSMSPATQGAAVPPEDEFWDQGAGYIGAVEPGSHRPWYAGWTDFPKS